MGMFLALIIQQYHYKDLERMLLNKRYGTPLMHAVLWGALVLIISLQLYFIKNELPVNFFYRIGLNIGLFYINYSLLIPLFLLKQKKYIYILSLIALVFVAYKIQIHPTFQPPFRISLMNEFDGLPPNSIRKGLRSFPVLVTILFLFLGIAIRMYQAWYLNEKKKKEIEAEKNLSELEALKNQINPHFLFNSLNSIYALAGKKSDDTPHAVIMLSELMRYMLYQTNEEYVPLKNELDYLTNYVSLQKIRLVNCEDVEINIKGTITNQRIKPLLFISIIENAFKYGTNYLGKTKVKILIEIEDHVLHFSCQNLIGNYTTNRGNSGIGLQNTKDRFKLSYPGKHMIEIKENDDMYIVNVSLILN